ncbi:transcriptional regulator [Elizabethkingia anophelis]|nr:transcriptional regulator [Elizabethkingia anophelis]
MALGKRIREVRESKGLLLREIGAALELDNAFISKIENEEKLIPKKHLENLAEFLNLPLEELLILWLSDKIKGLIDDKEIGKQALKNVLNELKRN